MSNIKTVSSNHNKAELNGELKSSDEQKKISAIAATRILAPPPPTTGQKQKLPPHKRK